MANNKNFIAKNGVSTGDGYSMPDVRPSLLLDFANSKTLDPRITFTRGSTATYWDGHTTTKAEENLLSYSQELHRTSHWSRFETTVTENATTAPDGTTTAEALIETTSNNYHNLAESIDYSGSASFYIKANGRTKGNFRFLSGVPNTSNSILFDLSAETVDVQSSGTSATITDVGNSWYRIGITGISNANRFIVEIRNNSNQSVYAGDGSSGFYIWGFQAENRDSVTAYTATTSTAIVKYQPTLQTAASGEARFDHDPVTGESKGLLIEEARTNLITRSEAFDSSYWTKLNASVQSGSAHVAPDGTLSAFKFSESMATGQHVLYRGSLLSQGTEATGSAFVKAGEKTFVLLSSVFGSGANAIYDLSNGTVTVTGNATTATTIEHIGNGWYRCSFTWTTTGTTEGFGVYLLEDNNDPDASDLNYTGDGFSGIHVWGTQLEAGGFPTSYIKTVSTTVTRSSEVCEVGGVSSWYSADRGTMYAEYTQFGLGSLNTSGIWEIYDKSSSTTGWDFRNTTTESILYAQPDNGNQQVILSGASTGGLNVEHRAVVSWSTSGIRVATEDDATSVTSNANSTFAAYEMDIGRHDRNNGRILNGHFKKVSYTPAEYGETTVRAMLEE